MKAVQQVITGQRLGHYGEADDAAATRKQKLNFLVYRVRIIFDYFQLGQKDLVHYVFISQQRYQEGTSRRWKGDHSLFNDVLSGAWLYRSLETTVDKTEY